MKALGVYKGEDEKSIKEKRNKRNWAMIHAHLGNAYSKNRQYDDAIASFREAIRINESVQSNNPDNAEAFYGLGMVYSGKGQKRLAADYIYRAGIIFLEKSGVGGTPGESARKMAIKLLEELDKIDPSVAARFQRRLYGP